MVGFYYLFTYLSISKIARVYNINIFAISFQWTLDKFAIIT